MPVQEIATCVAHHARQLYVESMPLLEDHQWPAVFVAAKSAATEVCINAEQQVRDLRRLFTEGAPLHLKQVFDPDGLPETPIDWHPVPVCAATAQATLAILIVNELLGMETISYASENAGKLFVNLVTLPGTGALAEKSTSNMRGHTDAVSFPFPGDSDPSDDRIGPSPDAVCLVGLRNNQQVPTTYIPLSDVLTQLTPADIQVLKEGRFIINAQRTFRRGTEAALGEQHSVDGGKILAESDGGMWVRYSHSNVTVDDTQQRLQEAQQRFEEACASCHQHLVLLPGDVAIINNRKALHGRGFIGEHPGGLSRWILRSYGLDTSRLRPEQATHRRGHILFP